jgi:hypothetical protein
MPRFKNVNWTVKQAEGEPGSATNVGEAKLAVLMDLRDELQALVRACFGIPQSITKELRRITRQLKLQRRCPVHPRYTGAKAPRGDCRACRRFYKAVWK